MKCWLIFIVPFYLHAYEFLELYSDKVFLEENKVVLSENVSLYTDSIIVQTNKATLEKISPEKDYLSMEDGVVFDSFEEGTLYSERALLDFLSHKITFFSEKNPVHFYRYISDKLFELNCKEIHTRLFPSSSIFEIAISNIKEVHFVKDIFIAYNNSCHLKGGYSVFCHPEKKIPFCWANIKLYPNPPKKYCFMKESHLSLQGRYIHWDFYKDLLFIQSPNGHIDMPEEMYILFSGDELLWKRKNNQLTLLKNGQIGQKDIFRLMSEKIDFTFIENRALSSISSSGEGKCDFYEKGLILYNGSWLFDYPNQCIDIYADSNEWIVFKNKDYYLKAKRGSLKFKEENHRIVPTLVSFSENVQIIKNKSSDLCSYATCNSMDIFLLQNYCALSGSKNEEVLFWQKEPSLKMRAQEIHINKNQEIKGIGKVSFSFDEEQKLLQLIQ